MRILHTSDWHLGRSFGPVSLAADQQAFIDWLVRQCGEQRADLVVIAGDIYDRAIMPTESVELFREALRRIRDTGASVAAITGNHDSAPRVAAYGDLLDQSGIYLRGAYSRLGEVIPLEFRDGPLDLVLLPFLDPQAAPDDLVDATVKGEDDAVSRRVRRTHESVLQAAADAARARLRAPRSLAVAHAFVAGGEESESERQLTVGGTGQVGAQVFGGFSYTALGHLHRPQNASGTLRYSGTPLAYSFSEAHGKSLTLLDLAPEGTFRLEEIGIPVGRPVRTVSGKLAGLLAGPKDSASFVRAIVTDRETVLDAKARLSEVFPNLVEVRLQPEGARLAGGEGPVDRIREMQPLEAVRRFWREAEGSDPDAETDALLAASLEAALRSGAA